MSNPNDRTFSPETRRFVDLHTHSRCSDGSLRPADVVDLAERCQLAAVALTDHDTTAGLAEARAQAKGYPELRFLGGIEVSAIFPSGTLHILGLGIDEASAPLAALTARLRAAREERNPKMIAKLQAIGVGIDLDDVLSCAGATTEGPRVVGRLHMAMALQRRGCVRSLDEAFARYLGNDGPAYVDKERTRPAEAIGAIRSAKGTAVLAHPPHLRYQNAAQLERIVRELISAGLGGIECYHSDHTPEQTRLYLDLARRFDLLVTGGSDFHGQGKPDVRLGKPRVPASQVRWERLSQA